MTRARLSRRSLLRGAAALALAAPPPARPAAAGDVLNFMGWSAYDHTALFAAFTAKTGIKVNFIEQSDQDAMLAQCMIAARDGSIDLVEPTVDRVNAWVAADLLQPFDEAQLPMEAYEPAFLTGAAAGPDGRRWFAPSVWGTEALLCGKDDPAAAYGAASLNDLFDPKNAGKVTVRAYSALAAMGRLLEAQGRLPKPWRDSYKDPETMTALWDIAVAEAIKAKANIVQFWSAEQEAQAAFRVNGATLGLTWDSTAFNLAQDGLPWTFVAPKEGAFGWLQGYFLPKAARNVAPAYEFVRFVASPEGAALHAKVFSANPTTRGAVELLDPAVAAFYKAAYPQDALAKLWWWPAMESWSLKLRTDYANRWKAA